MADRYIIYYMDYLDPSKAYMLIFDGPTIINGEGRIIAETNKEAEEEWLEQNPITREGFSRRILNSRKDFENKLSPDEEKQYYDKKKREQNERNKRNYDFALANLREAKSKIRTALTSADFALLTEEFSRIVRELRSLSGSFDLQAQIEECETYRKQCEEKMNQCKKDETFSLFNTAKTKMSTMRTSNEYGSLANEFADILQTLRSLSGPFVIQAQIEECNNCRKQCEEKMNQCKKDETLSLFNTAKTKISTRRTSNEYGSLANEFAGILQTLRSIPVSFDLQAQIEECDNCRKQCEEKKQVKQRQEETKRKIKKVVLSILYFAVVAGLLFAVYRFRFLLRYTENMRVIVAVIFGIVGAIIGFFGANGGCLAVLLGIPIGGLIGGGLVGYLLIGWLLSFFGSGFWIVILVTVLVLSIVYYRIKF